MGNVAEAIVLAVGVWMSTDAAMPRADLDSLRDAGVPLKGEALLTWLRPRLPADGDAGRLAELIGKLGDRSFAVRDKATADLIGLGPKAAPALRRALLD